tara:strand:- start:6743 stop:7756 length:1014 start_codon:yes stop_codon:yes gene_type:complete
MHNTQEKVIYRVDGGRVWGVSMGHIKRAMISATALKGLYEVFFVMKNYADGVQYVRNAGFEVETISKNDDTDATLIEIVDKHRPAKVIFDLKENPYKKFFEFARGEKIQTIVFDILGKCDGAPDVIINDSIVPEYTSYTFNQKNTTVLTGPEYFLSEGLPTPLPLNEKVINVAITMGGSDPAAITKKIVKFLTTHEDEKIYHIVLGPLFPVEEEKEIRRLCLASHRFRIYRNPPNFLELLAVQDLIICAGGRTLYECAYLGRPAIVVPSIDHENTTAQIYNQLTRCQNVGLWTDKTAQAIWRAIEEYGSIRFRKEVSNLGRNLVDGLAYNRIMNIIK